VIFALSINNFNAVFSRISGRLQVSTDSSTDFLEAVLWIRIRKDPKLFAGSGSVTRGYGFGSETGLKSY
jgi:hypothetical protein